MSFRIREQDTHLNPNPYVLLVARAYPPHLAREVGWMKIWTKVRQPFNYALIDENNRRFWTCRWTSVLSFTTITGSIAVVSLRSMAESTEVEYDEPRTNEDGRSSPGYLKESQCTARSACFQCMSDRTFPSCVKFTFAEYLSDWQPRRSR